ncbi:hypothetical protein DFJ74DRAFT_703419 [Hyaloraphidium curvatum]|nr:hypothetical protein DFJ74DRAFT_703419 [Hyaloraphidium curvatum]
MAEAAEWGILTLDYDPRILRATLHPVHHVLGEVVFGAALNDDFVIESGHSYIFQQSVGSGGRDSEELLDDQFTALASLLNQHDMSFQLLHFALRKLAELVIKGQRLQKDKERADEEARERTRRRDWIWKVAAVIGAVMLFVAAVSMAPDVAGGAKAAVNYFLGLLASLLMEMDSGGLQDRVVLFASTKRCMCTILDEVVNLGEVGARISNSRPMDDPYALVCVPGVTRDFVRVRLRGVEDEAALRAAVGRDAGLPATAAVLELRSAGPLRPSVPGAAAAWDAAAPLPPRGPAFARALHAMHLLGRVGGRSLAPEPLPPPLAPRRPDATGPAVWALLRYDRLWGLHRAGLDARAFGSLELRCVGLDPPGKAPGDREAAWKGASCVADDDPFPDRARGLDWDSWLIAQTCWHRVEPDDVGDVPGGLAGAAMSAGARIRSWLGDAQLHLDLALSLLSSRERMLVALELQRVNLESVNRALSARTRDETIEPAAPQATPAPPAVRHRLDDLRDNRRSMSRPERALDVSFGVFLASLAVFVISWFLPKSEASNWILIGLAILLVIEIVAIFFLHQAVERSRLRRQTQAIGLTNENAELLDKTARLVEKEIVFVKRETELLGTIGDLRTERLADRNEAYVRRKEAHVERNEAQEAQIRLLKELNRWYWAACLAIWAAVFALVYWRFC